MRGNDNSRCDTLESQDPKNDSLWGYDIFWRYILSSYLSQKKWLDFNHFVQKLSKPHTKILPIITELFNNSEQITNFRSEKQMTSENIFVGKFCVFLHHYGGPLMALWSLMLNSYLRKEDLRRCKSKPKRNIFSTINWYTFSFDLVIKNDVIAYYWYGFKEWLTYKKNKLKCRVVPEIDIEMVPR